MQQAVVAEAEVDQVLLFHTRADVEIAQSRRQFANTPCGCEPLGQPHEIVDKPDQRALHRHEGGHNLHHRAERQGARQIFRRDKPQRYDGKQRAICVEHNRDLALLRHDLQPRRDAIGVIGAQGGEFVLAALDQSDRFRIFAQTRHFGAKLRFHFVLVANVRHQRTTCQIGRRRRHHRINDGRNRHIGRNFVNRAAVRQRKTARRLPENGGEGRRRDRGAEQAKREFNQRLDRHARIVGDAKLRRREIGRDETEAVMALTGQPPAFQMIAQPGASEFAAAFARRPVKTR